MRFIKSAALAVLLSTAALVSAQADEACIAGGELVEFFQAAKVEIVFTGHLEGVEAQAYAELTGFPFPDKVTSIDAIFLPQGKVSMMPLNEKGCAFAEDGTQAPDLDHALVGDTDQGTLKARLMEIQKGMM